MTRSDLGIEHVSDTALTAAAFRAMESERPDGLIRDEHAARLAGDRGMALMHDLKAPHWLQLGTGLRARLLDELLLAAVVSGADGVLNLGAGLDARAWRLELPAALRWIETDFSEMLDYKFDVLHDVIAHCRVERMSADLRNAHERQRVLTAAASGLQRPLLITEGLLMYLSADTVHELAMEARAAGFRFWLLDSTSTALMQRVHGQAIERINRVRAESYLEGPNLHEALGQQGWQPRGRRLFHEEAPRPAPARINEMLVAQGVPLEPTPGDDSGVWLYEFAR